eukprot:6189955-Pleurochrysis_carterae.AAC.11
MASWCAATSATRKSLDADTARQTSVCSTAAGCGPDCGVGARSRTTRSTEESRTVAPSCAAAWMAYFDGVCALSVAAWDRSATQPVKLSTTHWASMFTSTFM